jgi:DNA-binding beta-propeller fold protein YncE
VAHAHLVDPRAIHFTSAMTLVAGGTSGTVQAVRTAASWVEVVAGRYPHTTATGQLARFRDDLFGTVGGLAYDEATGTVYISERDQILAITIVDPDDETTWTIATLTGGAAGFADGALAVARFRSPTGLYMDTAAHTLYVADTGNHVVRAIALSASTVSTVAGLPAQRGLFGDGGPATAGLLFAPEAVTRCTNGDLFVADTGNHRVRRIAAGTGVISTVLGDGVPASSGEGAPATTFPINAPRSLACDARGNLFVTSTTTVRLLPSDAGGQVDGSGPVETIYGASRVAFPEIVTACLSGLSVVDAKTVQITDACSGVLIQLERAIVTP